MQRLRGIFRLLAFVAVACYFLLRIFLRQAFTPRSRQQVIHREMERWARALIPVMGLEVEVSGNVPRMFVVAAEQGLPVVPVVLEYANLGDAWIGDDSFLPHFLRCFAKARTQVRLHFGPLMRDEDPESLRTRASHWLCGQLDTLEAELGLPTGQTIASTPNPAQ